MIAAKQYRIKEAVEMFLVDRERYYDSGEGPTRQLANVRSGLNRWLVRLVGDRWLYELDGVLLDHVLGEWVRSGELTRTSINRNLSFVRQLMKFCVRRGMARSEQLVSIQAVDRIRSGRYGVIDRPPVRPVSEANYTAALAQLPHPVRTMVELLYHTGMRPGEVRLMRIDRLKAMEVDGEPCVLYLPHQHKTMHLNKRRSIPIVRQGLALLERHLNEHRLCEHSDGYVFSADGLGYEPLAEGVIPREVRRACDAAGVARWTPMQLRHRFGTQARQQGLGLKDIAPMMGHARTRTTEIYAEPCDLEAARCMLRISRN